MDLAQNYVIAMMGMAQPIPKYILYLTGDMTTTGTSYVNYPITLQLPSGTYIFESALSSSNIGVGGARIEIVPNLINVDNTHCVFTQGSISSNGGNSAPNQGARAGVNNLQYSFYSQLDQGGVMKMSQANINGLTVISDNVTMTMRLKMLAVGLGAGTGRFHAGSYIKFDKL